MSIAAWVVVGIIGGWLGRFVVRATGTRGLLNDLVVGIAGGLLGGAIFSWFGHLTITGFNIPSIFVAFVGSVILLLIVRVFTSSKTSA
jgi:uncharacterized membrane protein YeaQ/YmgE (transglycosylase-associated protein family)